MKILNFSSVYEVEQRQLSACSPIGPACNCNSQCRSLTSCPTIKKKYRSNIENTDIENTEKEVSSLAIGKLGH